MKRVGAWLTRYPHYKLASLIIATGLWLVQRVAHNPIKEVTLDVPVEVQNLPEGWAILNAPERVKLVLKGPAMFLDRVAQRASTQIDVKGLQAGWHEVEIVDQKTAGVQVVAVDPDTAIVTLDELDTKEFEVSHTIVGEAEPGYATEPPSLNPTKVTLTGLKGILGRVRQARIYIDISGREKDFHDRVVVWPVDEENQPVNDVKVEPPNTLATVRVRRQREPKTVAINAVVKGRPAEGFTFGSISVTPNTVTLLIQPENRERINFVDTEPLNVSGARNTVSRPLRLRLPRGVELLPGGMITALVEVEIRPVERADEPAR